MPDDWDAVAALTGMGKMHTSQGPAPTICEMATGLRARIDFMLVAVRDDLVGAGIESVIASVMAENATLRGLVAKVVMPCHYCGVDNMAKCPSGFPGCALADDLLCGEDDAQRRRADHDHA